MSGESSYKALKLKRVSEDVLFCGAVVNQDFERAILDTEGNYGGLNCTSMAAFSNQNRCNYHGKIKSSLKNKIQTHHKIHSLECFKSHSEDITTLN